MACYFVTVIFSCNNIIPYLYKETYRQFHEKFPKSNPYTLIVYVVPLCPVVNHSPDLSVYLGNYKW